MWRRLGCGCKHLPVSTVLHISYCAPPNTNNVAGDAPSLWRGPHAAASCMCVDGCCCNATPSPTTRQHATFVVCLVHGPQHACMHVCPPQLTGCWCVLFFGRAFALCLMVMMHESLCPLQRRLHKRAAHTHTQPTLCVGVGGGCMCVFSIYLAAVNNDGVCAWVFGLKSKCVLPAACVLTPHPAAGGGGCMCVLSRTPHLAPLSVYLAGCVS